MNQNSSASCTLLISVLILMFTFFHIEMGVDYKGIAEQTTTKEIASNKQNMDYLTLRDKQLQVSQHNYI